MMMCQKYIYEDKLQIGLLLLLRLILLAWFFWHQPVLEQFDEAYHYEVVRFIAQENVLATSADIPPIYESYQIFQQYNQPPLSYLLTAPFAAIFDTSPSYPIQSAGVAFCYDAQAAYYIHPSNPNQDLRGTILGVKAARFVIAALTSLAIFPLWGAMRLVYPNSRRLAFSTVFLFVNFPPALDISTWVNTDALQILWGACLVFIAARYSRGLFNWRDIVGLCLLAMLASFTKLTGFIAFVPFGFVLLRLKNWNWLALIAASLLILAVLGFNLASCGTIFCRLHRYSFPIESWEQLISSLRLDLFSTGFWQMLRLWAIPALRPTESSALEFVRLFILLLWFFAAFGLIFAVWKSPLYRRFFYFLFPLVLAAFCLSLARIWWLQVGFWQARYLSLIFPIAIVFLAMAYQEYSQLWGQWLNKLLLIIMFLAAILSPILAYRLDKLRPQILREIPNTIQTIESIQFLSGLEILGYSMDEQVDINRIQILMRAQSPIKSPQFLILSLYDIDENLLGRCGQLAGTGFYSAEEWQSDDYILQNFSFPNIEAIAHLEFELYLLENSSPLISLYDERAQIKSVGINWLALDAGN